MSSDAEAARLLPDEEGGAVSSLSERRTGRADEAQAAARAWKQARLGDDGRQRISIGGSGLTAAAAAAAATGSLLSSCFPSRVLLSVAAVAAMLLLLLLSLQLQHCSSASASSCSAVSYPAQSSSPSPSCAEPAAAAGSGPRVLVAMFDTRRLSGGDGFQWDTVSMAAYINFLYTRLHRRHEFVFVHSLPTANAAAIQQQLAEAEAAARSGSGNSSSIARFARSRAIRAKRAPGCYNSALRQWRAAPWCKIAAVHHLLMTRSGFDWLLFIDSDAVFSNYRLPVDFWLQAVADWAPGADSQSRCSAASFLAAAPASRCTALFANNDPWEKTAANTGLWLLRRGDAAEPGSSSSSSGSATNHSLQFLRRWWHQSMPARNMEHAYEQDALQLLLSRTPEQEREQLTALLSEPSMLHRSAVQLVHHWTEADRGQRALSFRRLVRRLQSDSTLTARCIDTNVTRVMQRIAATATVSIDLTVDSIALPTPPDTLPAQPAVSSNSSSASQQRSVSIHRQG